MRRRFLVTLVVPLLGASGYACGSDPSASATSDGGASLDGATAPLPTGDASVANDGAPSKDASPGEAAPTEAGSSDAGAPIVVHVADPDGNPGAAIDVYFVDGAGTITAMKTAADGRATYAAAGATTVWAVQFLYGDRYTTTSVDVQPGETVQVSTVLGSSSPPPSKLGQAYGTIAAPMGFVVANTGYAVIEDEPCTAIGNSTFPMQYDFHPLGSCLDTAGAYNYVLGAFDQSSMTYVAFAFKSAAVTGGDVQANVVTSDWQVAVPQQITVTGDIPPVFQKGGYVLPWFIRDHRAYRGDGASVPGGNSAVSYTPFPATFAPEIVTATSFMGSGEGTTWGAWHFARNDIHANLAEDLGTMVPRIHQLTITGSATAPHVAWQEDGPRAQDGFMQLEMHGYVPTDAGSNTSYWYVSAPLGKSATAIDPPPIPPPLRPVMESLQWAFEQAQTVSSSSPLASYGRTLPTMTYGSMASFVALLPVGKADVYMQTLSVGE